MNKKGNGRRSDLYNRGKAFWESRALNTALPKGQVTHPDQNQRILEIEVLLSYLPRGMRILDVGCGNGFSTGVFAEYASYILGIDSSTAMIQRAKNEFGQLPNVEFQVQDVVKLEGLAKSFDVVISQRCLINLTTWGAQQKAITNIAKVLKPGGYFFLQEGTQQGREQLNQVREFFGLGQMPKVKYNLDLDEQKLWPFIRRYFDIIEIRRFGLYDLISRVVHPILVSPSEPQYDAKINEVARRISAKLRGMGYLSREFSAFLRRLDQSTA
jgi:SAM-dependent methyltransferase